MQWKIHPLFYQFAVWILHGCPLHTHQQKIDAVQQQINEE